MDESHGFVAVMSAGIGFMLGCLLGGCVNDLHWSGRLQEAGIAELYKNPLTGETTLMPVTDERDE